MTKDSMVDQFPRLRPPGHRSQQVGFTLTELLVALGLVAILGTLATNTLFRRNQRVGVQSLSRQIQALASQARLAAMANRKQVWLHLSSDVTAVEMRIALVLGNATLSSGQFGPVEMAIQCPEQSRILGVAAGALLSSTPPSVAGTVSADLFFYPDGTLRLAGETTTGATIYLADSMLQSRHRLVLFGRTAYAKVLDR